MKRNVAGALALIVLIVAESAFAQEPAPKRFENATAGITLMRPPGWHTASLQAVQENRERVQLSDPEFQAAMQKLATAPLFVFTKYLEPHDNLNPSIQVTVRALGQLAGTPPADIMKMLAGQLQKAFADFAFVTDVTTVEVSGLVAAQTRATYTLKNREGREFKVLSRMWLVPRGAHMFIIGMSGPPEGPDVSESEFSATLASISIRK